MPVTEKAIWSSRSVFLSITITITAITRAWATSLPRTSTSGVPKTF